MNEHQNGYSHSEQHQIDRLLGDATSLPTINANPSQPRDEHGRWAASESSTRALAASTTASKVFRNQKRATKALRLAQEAAVASDRAYNLSADTDEQQLIASIAHQIAAVLHYRAGGQHQREGYGAQGPIASGQVFGAHNEAMLSHGEAEQAHLYAARQLGGHGYQKSRDAESASEATGMAPVGSLHRRASVEANQHNYHTAARNHKRAAEYHEARANNPKGRNKTAHREAARLHRLAAAHHTGLHQGLRGITGNEGVTVLHNANGGNPNQPRDDHGRWAASQSSQRALQISMASIRGGKIGDAARQRAQRAAVTSDWAYDAPIDTEEAREIAAARHDLARHRHVEAREAHVAATGRHGWARIEDMPSELTRSHKRAAQAHTDAVAAHTDAMRSLSGRAEGSETLTYEVWLASATAHRATEGLGANHPAERAHNLSAASAIPTDRRVSGLAKHHAAAEKLHRGLVKTASSPAKGLHTKAANAHAKAARRYRGMIHNALPFVNNAGFDPAQARDTHGRWAATQATQTALAASLQTPHIDAIEAAKEAAIASDKAQDRKDDLAAAAHEKAAVYHDRAAHHFWYAGSSYGHETNLHATAAAKHREAAHKLGGDSYEASHAAELASRQTGRHFADYSTGYWAHAVGARNSANAGLHPNAAYQHRQAAEVHTKRAQELGDTTYHPRAARLHIQAAEHHEYLVANKGLFESMPSRQGVGSSPFARPSPTDNAASQIDRLLGTTTNSNGSHYDPDQPRDEHGRWAAGEASQRALQASLASPNQTGIQRAQEAAIASDRAQDAKDEFTAAARHQRAAQRHFHAAEPHIRGTRGMAPLEDAAHDAHLDAARRHYDAVHSLGGTALTYSSKAVIATSQLGAPHRGNLAEARRAMRLVEQSRFDEAAPIHRTVAQAHRHQAQGLPATIAQRRHVQAAESHEKAAQFLEQMTRNTHVADGTSWRPLATNAGFDPEQARDPHGRFAAGQHTKRALEHSQMHASLAKHRKTGTRLSVRGLKLAEEAAIRSDRAADIPHDAPQSAILAAIAHEKAGNFHMLATEVYQRDEGASPNISKFNDVRAHNERALETGYTHRKAAHAHYDAATSLGGSSFYLSGRAQHLSNQLRESYVTSALAGRALNHAGRGQYAQAAKVHERAARNHERLAATPTVSQSNQVAHRKAAEAHRNAAWYHKQMAKWRGPVKNQWQPIAGPAHFPLHLLANDSYFKTCERRHGRCVGKGESSEDMQREEGEGSTGTGSVPTVRPELPRKKSPLSRLKDKIPGVRYGHFCGPGPARASGPRGDCSKLSDGSKPPVPKDSVDAACAQHDKDYCHCGASWKSKASDCTKKADADLVQRLKEGHKGLKSRRARVASKVIQHYFGRKLKGDTHSNETPPTHNTNAAEQIARLLGAPDSIPVVSVNAGFDPNQARDPHGRFAAGEATQRALTHTLSGKNAKAKEHAKKAAIYSDRALDVTVTPADPDSSLRAAALHQKAARAHDQANHHHYQAWGRSTSTWRDKGQETRVHDYNGYNEHGRAADAHIKAVKAMGGTGYDRSIKARNLTHDAAPGQFTPLRPNSVEEAPAHAIWGRFAKAAQAHATAAKYHEREVKRGERQGLAKSYIAPHRAAAVAHREAERYHRLMVANLRAMSPTAILTNAWSDAARKASIAARQATAAAKKLTDATKHRQAKLAARYADIMADAALGDSERYEKEPHIDKHGENAANMHRIAASWHDSASGQHGNIPRRVRGKWRIRSEAELDAHETARKAHEEASVVHRDAAAEYEDRLPKRPTGNSGWTPIARSHAVNANPNQPRDDYGRWAASEASVRALQSTQFARKQHVSTTSQIRAKLAPTLKHAEKAAVLSDAAYNVPDDTPETRALAAIAHDKASKAHHDAVDAHHKVARFRLAVVPGAQRYSFPHHLQAADAHRAAALAHNGAANRLGGNFYTKTINAVYASRDAINNDPAPLSPQMQELERRAQRDLSVALRMSDSPSNAAAIHKRLVKYHEAMATRLGSNNELHTKAADLHRAAARHHRGLVGNVKADATVIPVVTPIARNAPVSKPRSPDSTHNAWSDAARKASIAARQATAMARSASKNVKNAQEARARAHNAHVRAQMAAHYAEEHGRYPDDNGIAKLAMENHEIAAEHHDIAAGRHEKAMTPVKRMSRGRLRARTFGSKAANQRARKLHLQAATLHRDAAAEYRDRLPPEKSPPTGNANPLTPLTNQRPSTRKTPMTVPTRIINQGPASTPASPNDPALSSVVDTMSKIADKLADNTKILGKLLKTVDQKQGGPASSPNRPKRSFTITHDDGTTSTITENDIGSPVTKPPESGATPML